MAETWTSVWQEATGQESNELVVAATWTDCGSGCDQAARKEFRDMRIAKRRIKHGANLPTFTALILDLSDIRDLLALADVLVRVFGATGCDSKVFLIDGSV